ncbi:uncharacterized protein FTOL_08074 [Fusarium torulosum]|uniref:Uncharacterized protein n=1 Tax=Fusarium torulosum TaxID=33205 RepID=A0AAE8MCZ4_9HYPO|nr:uncharacterized protein FTOL_08074 [Fusarium torulosum]
MSNRFPDWFMAMKSPSQSSTSDIEDEPKTDPKTEPKTELEVELEDESEAELEAREDHNSKSSTSTPPAVEESPGQISDKLRCAVDLVDSCCLEASTGYIQEFMTAFENRDEKDHNTELGRRCYQIYKEKKATNSLRTNTGTICHILQIQASSIALLMASTLVVDSRIQKLCIVAKRIETAQEVFKSPKVDNEDSRLRAVFVSGILYCQLLHREDKAGYIHGVAKRFHKGQFDITGA